MPSIEMWRQIQAASGLAFGFFLSIHLFSHFCLNISWQYGHQMLLQMREIYQHPLFEAQLVLALILHLTSDAVLYLHRKKVEWKRVNKKNDDDDTATADHNKEATKTYTPGSAELQLHRYAGHFLAFMIFAHVFSTRIAALLWLPDPSMYDYTFITQLENKVPYHLFTVLLYIFGAAGLWHLLYGSYIASAIITGSSVKGKDAPSFLLRVAFLGHLAVLSTILALKGTYYDIPLEGEKAIDCEMLLSKMGL